jgi:PAS domain S-box-containing protein
LQAINQRLEHECQERQRMQTTLQISEERFRKLIEVTQSIVWSVDATGRFITPQPSWEQFTGQTWEQYRDFGRMNAVHPEDREALREAWSRAVQTSTPYQANYRLWFREGYYRHVIANAAPLHNQEGQVYEWIGCCLDVHVLRQTEEALHLVSERMELALQASGVGTWCWDIIADKMTWDERHYKLFGLTAQTFAATYAAFLERVHPDDRTRVTEAIAKTFQEGIDYSIEYRVIWPNNTIHIHSTRAKIYFDTHRTPQRLTGVSWDITQKKRLEEEHLQALTSAALHQRERAQAAESHKVEIQQLMHLLCHEIRNPLTGIQGMIDWLNDIQLHLFEILKILSPSSNEPPQSNKKVVLHDIREALAFIHKGLLEVIEIDKEAVLHLNDVVTDVLEHAKVEAGKLKINHTPFDPAHIINAVLKMQSSNKLLLTKKLKINLKTPDEEIILKGDSAKLKVIILNLVTNAIKYTDQGEITITLKQQVISVTITELQISVADTGVGMDEEDQKQLFQRFAQVGNRIFKPSGGSGLGLSIVKGYTDAMGGKMTVMSQKHKGSTFYLSIPCDNLTEEEKREHRQQLIDENLKEKLILKESSMYKKHVLIVEDNLVNQRILSRIS